MEGEIEVNSIKIYFICSFKLTLIKELKKYKYSYLFID